MLLIAHCFSFVCLFSNVVRALLLRNVDDDVEMDMKNWFWLVSFISFLSFFLFFFHFKWNAEAPFFGWTHPLLWTAIFIPQQLLWFRLDIVLDLKTFCFSSGWEGGSDVFSGRKWRLLWHVSHLGAFLSCPTWRHLTVEGRASDFSCPFISFLSTFGRQGVLLKENRRSLVPFRPGQEKVAAGCERSPARDFWFGSLLCNQVWPSSKRRHFSVPNETKLRG
jgi:hypothetical protein